MSVIILESQYDSLLRAADHASPDEACGLFIGIRGRSSITLMDFHLSENVTLDDPRTSFEIDPKLHLTLQRTARKTDHMLVGVWHSHPAGPAFPSEKDRVRSLESGMVWLITGRPVQGQSTHGWETQAFVAGDNPHSLHPSPLQVGSTLDLATKA